MTYSPTQIRSIREGLGMTQVQLASLVGVHPITIAKWEAEWSGLQPNAFQQQLLEHYAQAVQQQPSAGAPLWCENLRRTRHERSRRLRDLRERSEWRGSEGFRSAEGWNAPMPALR